MLSSSQREFYNSATMTYAAALSASAAAQAYLTKRGLSQASAQSFQLGVVESPLTGHEQYQGRLAIPYLTRSGACGMAFRCIAHEDCKAVKCPKYMWPSGFSRRMFNTSALDTPSSFIAICEGEIDTMTAVQAGIPAVGIPGAEAWQGFWARVLKGYDTVFVLADNDDSGVGKKMAEKISRDVPQARTVLMPEGHDVNSFALENGSDALRARIGLDSTYTLD